MCQGKTNHNIYGIRLDYGSEVFQEYALDHVMSDISQVFEADDILRVFKDISKRPGEKSISWKAFPEIILAVSQV